MTMRFKRAGILTKLVVLVLLIYMATSLMDLRGKIQTVEEQRDVLKQQVANQQLQNQELEDAIANSDDPDMMEQVAREKGFVKQGEELRKQLVRLGESNFELVEVVSGLRPGDEVVVSDMELYKSKNKLKIK